MKEYKDNIDLDDIMFDNGADKEDKLEEKACNEVDLPGLGKMEFLTGKDFGDEEGYFQLKTVAIGISEGSAESLNENEAKREEFSKSYEAFWTCGSKVSDNVNKSIGIFFQKFEERVKGIVGAGFGSFSSKIGNHEFQFQNWACSGAKEIFHITLSYFEGSSFFVIDGYCDSVFKEKVAKMIDSEEIEADRVVFIKRCDNEGKVVDEKGTKALEDQLKKNGCEGNVVDGNSYKALAEKGKEMYTKLLSEYVSKDTTGKKIVLSDFEVSEDEGHKRHKNGFSKLLNRVKENKGKTMFTLFGLLSLEELWRNGFFSGDKTNEKEKAKNLKKLVEQKDTDKYPNRKDKNSAAT